MPRTLCRKFRNVVAYITHKGVSCVRYIQHKIYYTRKSWTSRRIRYTNSTNLCASDNFVLQLRIFSNYLRAHDIYALYILCKNTNVLNLKHTSPSLQFCCTIVRSYLEPSLALFFSMTLCSTLEIFIYLGYFGNHSIGFFFLL